MDERVPCGTALYLRSAPTEPPYGVSVLAHNDRSRRKVQRVTPRASAWLRDNVGEEATWVGDALFVEHRYWPDLVDGVIAAGFTFERNKLPN